MQYFGNLIKALSGQQQAETLSKYLHFSSYFSGGYSREENLKDCKTETTEGKRFTRFSDNLDLKFAG